MVCKAGKVCRNCAECFGCHAMKSTFVVGNCRPKNSRICPKEKALRRAEEQTQKLNGGQSSLQNYRLTQPMPSISKTISGGTTSYVIRGECSMSIDQFGRHIRFPQYSDLTFSSMESAFGYFEAQTKLQNHHAFQATGQLFQATGQLIGHAAQQAHRSRALGPCERIWQFDTSLEPANVKPLVRLPAYSYLGIQGHQFASVVDPVSQDTRQAPDPFPLSSRSSPPQPPPQTLFAESTPHARDIQAQPRVRLSAQVLQSWALHSQALNSQATTGSNMQQPLPLPPASDPRTLVEDDTASHTHHNILSSSLSQEDEVLAQPQSSYGSYALPSAYSATVLPQILARKDKRVLDVPSTADISSSFSQEDEILAQPQSSYGSYALPSAYPASVLPQTLARKDKRVLGVPLTADIDEIRAGFWLRVLQYNADRCQATSLEDRAVAALRLTRAQEAVDRLCGGRELD